MNGAGGGLTLGVFKDNLGQIFSCVLAGLHWREGEKLSHVVRCCLQLRAGFHPMHDCVPSVVTIAVRMVMTISTIRFNVNLFMAVEVLSVK